VAIDCESAWRSEVQNDVEVLHENVSQKVLSLIEAVSIDLEITYAISIVVLGVEKIVLWLENVGTVSNEVETESGPHFVLAIALVPASELSGVVALHGDIEFLFMVLL
jgi:hypothetical protein